MPSAKSYFARDDVDSSGVEAISTLSQTDTGTMPLHFISFETLKYHRLLTHWPLGDFNEILDK